jgi:hypothetical protein
MLMAPFSPIIFQQFSEFYVFEMLTYQMTDGAMFLKQIPTLIEVLRVPEMHIYCLDLVVIIYLVLYE